MIPFLFFGKIIDYTPISFKNKPDQTTPISAENLNHIQNGILTVVNGVNQVLQDLNAGNYDPAPYVLPEASGAVLGGIKVGSGLSISDGVLSTLNKEFLYVSRTINQEFTAVNQTVNFNGTIAARGITYSPATSQFTLKKDKFYRISFSTSIIFNIDSGYVSFSLFTPDNTKLIDLTALFICASTANMEAGNSGINFIYSPTADINACIKVAAISASTTATIRGGHAAITIQEL